MASRGALVALEYEAGTVFWLWMRYAFAGAIASAAGFFLFGQVHGVTVVIINFLLMGIPQAIIVHRYTQQAHWSQWLLLNSLATLVAVPVAMVIDVIAEAGGGLNPETDVRWCLCQGVAVVGFLFGMIQHMLSSARWIWGFIYSVAATIAALAGGMVGFWVYHALRAPLDYSFGYTYFGYGVSDTPHRAIGIAAGFLVGMTMYGIVTGLAVTYSVPLMYVTK
jgi:hypothetical protein